jgi:hypothetical protein
MCLETDARCIAQMDAYNMRGRVSLSHAIYPLPSHNPNQTRPNQTKRSEAKPHSHNHNPDRTLCQGSSNAGGKMRGMRRVAATPCRVGSAMPVCSGGLCRPRAYHTVLYCTELYCTVPNCTVPYCTVLYCAVWVWMRRFGKA